jgi:hypothetical protein
MVRALLAAAVLAASRTSRTTMHPLHTTLSDVTIDTARGVVRIVVRAFDDDLRRAAAPSRTSQPDSLAAAYVASAIALADGVHHVIVLRSCGTRHSGDLTWVCLEGQSAVKPLANVTMRQTMFCNLFRDQINIVQVHVPASSESRSVLFTNGDGFKRIDAR